MNRRLTLITGGVRSGKSRFALELAAARRPPLYFIATAEAFDLEMKSRIANHRKERKDRFVTIEEPVSLCRALQEAYQRGAGLIVIDCLTVWINNLLYYFEHEEKRIEEEIGSVLEAVKLRRMDLIFVTNETGMGLAADSPLTRKFVDWIGLVNREVAAASDEVILMVSGIPSWIKGSKAVHENLVS